MSALESAASSGHQFHRRAPRFAARPPVHDGAELGPAHDALWSALRGRLEARGVEAPARLARTGAPRWPSLLLGQVCGFGYMVELSEQVRPIVTPRYRVHGADGPFLRSVLLVRQPSEATSLSDLAGCRLVHEHGDENSANLLAAEVASLARGGAFFATSDTAPSFLSAAEGVFSGRYDALLLDGLAHAQLARLRPELAKGLRPVLWTSRAPGPPFVTGRDTPSEVVAALLDAFKDLEEDRNARPILDALLIAGFNPLPKAQYRTVLHFQQIASSQGYGALH